MKIRNAALGALMCSVLVIAVAGTPAAAKPSGPPPLQPVTTDQYEMLPATSFFVNSRVGMIYVELARPDVPAGMKVPTILTYTPYSALGYSTADGLGTFFGPKGYARAIAHVIGTGNSGGCWDYGGVRERQSGYDLVEYLGTRPWSNGKVGMIGGSYDGTTANMAAAENPPHLATIVPEVAISQWYGYAYHDGVRYFIMDPEQRQGLIINEQGFDTPAGFDFGFGLAPPLDPLDPNYDGRFVHRICPNADKVFHTQRGYDPEPDFDLFWRQRDYLSDANKLAIPDGQEIPVLVQGGWRDYNVKHSESTRWFEAIPVDDRRTPEDEGVPYKLMVMGQGAHGGIEPEMQWDITLHAWFDQFLYGYKTNIMGQGQSLSKANDGVVRRDPSWPPPGSHDVSFFLHPNESLTMTPPGADEGSDTYVDTGRMTESDALAMRDLPATGEYLWFESAPLTKDIRIAGLPKLDLYASSTATSTHYTPVLFDLGEPVTTTESICTYVPPQQACTVSRGFLNARYRKTLKRGDDLTPGEQYRAMVRFIDNDWVIKAGHRIGVAVMSSNLSWAIPDQQRAANTIYHDASRPSALILPVVGGHHAACRAGLM